MDKRSSYASNCNQHPEMDVGWQLLPEEIVRCEIIPFLGYKRLYVNVFETNYYRIITYFGHEFIFEIEFGFIHHQNCYKISRVNYFLNEPYCNGMYYHTRQVRQAYGTKCKIIESFIYRLVHSNEKFTPEQIDYYKGIKFLKELYDVYIIQMLVHDKSPAFEGLKQLFGEN